MFGTLPPATSTVPSLSRVIECSTRDALMLPVAVNAPVTGSNRSAFVVASAAEMKPPPTRSLCWLGRYVNDGIERAVVMLPTAVNVCDPSASTSFSAVFSGVPDAF